MRFKCNEIFCYTCQSEIKEIDDLNLEWLSDVRDLKNQKSSGLRVHHSNQSSQLSSGCREYTRSDRIDKYETHYIHARDVPGDIFLPFEHVNFLNNKYLLALVTQQEWDIKSMITLLNVVGEFSGRALMSFAELKNT